MDSHVLVLFGATGDLVGRMVLPALYHLFETDRLPKSLKVLGFSRRDLGNVDFKELVKKAVIDHLETGGDIEDSFLGLFEYQQGNFTNVKDYDRLHERLTVIDQDQNLCSNKLFHLAVPPQHYVEILNNISSSKLDKTCDAKDSWTRILVEKPYGSDLNEATKIDKILDKIFRDDQVYRIDHYLAKELLQNIIIFRFANNLLEHVWDNRSIEKIEVKLLESIGVKGRADTYDNLGALLDIGQNHLLQMLALVTMDAPDDLSPAAIRRARSRLLKDVRVLGIDKIVKGTTRGQYLDYLSETGVKKNSMTETYFKIKTSIDTKRWHGVPIILEAGKRAPRTEKEIAVTFYPSKMLSKSARATGLNKNTVYFRLEPDPGIAIRFWSKSPGPTMSLEQQIMEFKYEDIASGVRHLEGYSKLILDSIKGDQTLFITGEEALSGWHFIDPIIRAWRNNKVPLERYSSNEDSFNLMGFDEEDAIVDATTIRGG